MDFQFFPAIVARGWPRATTVPTAGGTKAPMGHCC